MGARIGFFIPNLFYVVYIIASKKSDEAGGEAHWSHIIVYNWYGSHRNLTNVVFFNKKMILLTDVSFLLDVNRLNKVLVDRGRVYP